MSSEIVLSVDDQGSPNLPNTSERMPREAARFSMAMAVRAWCFGAVFFNITTGAIYVAFARGIGANDFVFGLLAGALSLMCVLQVVAARLLEGSRRYRRQMMIAGLIGRSLWILAAVTPLIALSWPGLIGKEQVLIIVASCIVLSGAFQAFHIPVFFSWMTYLVPSRLRPMFLARRLQMGTWFALLASVVSGLVADHSPYLSTYCGLLVVAGVCGLLDILLYVGVREPHRRNDVIALQKQHMPGPRLLGMVRATLHDKPTRQFLGFVFLLLFSGGLQGSFAWLYAMEYLGLSKTMTGLLAGAVPMISAAATLRFWGRGIRLP